jgi:DNA-binding transcriptional regulator GbsR (MarR family)
MATMEAMAEAGDATSDEAGSPNAAKQHFVEDFALQMEIEGLPRMAGRILAWLLICDPPLQSAADLARVLRASKGSISTMTSLLVRTGLIDRTALPGDRRDYYRMRPDSLSSMMNSGIERLAALRRLAERGVTLVADQPPEQQERVEDLRHVAAFFEQEYPALMAKWQAQRAAQRNGAARS